MSQATILNTPENITHLEPNEIFVFGSNLGGRHGAGAALTALQKFGARQNVGCGRQGQSYGIPTKDKWLVTLPLSAIKFYVDTFLQYAVCHPELTFLVTRIGCGFAGYKPSDIAPMFDKAKTLPNVILPKDFK